MLEKVHPQISQELNFVIKQWNEDFKKIMKEWRCTPGGSKAFKCSVCFSLGAWYRKKMDKKGRVSRTIYDGNMEVVPV